MKLKDLHIDLNNEINLLKFYPKKEISVDSFGIEKNIINDIYKNKLKKTIKLKKNSEIKINKIKNKNNLDLIKIKKNKKINLNNSQKKSLKENFGYLNKKSREIPYIGKSGFIKKKFQKNIFTLNKTVKKIKYSKFIIYFILCLLIVFTDKITIEYLTNSAYKNLISINNGKNDINADKLIKKSNIEFKIANILFIPFKILPGKKINNANNAIIGGIKITNLGITLTDYINKTTKFIGKKGIENVMYSQLLENSKQIFIYSEKETNDIIKIYENINFSDNVLLKNKLNNFIEQAKEINYYLNNINNNFDIFLNILGHNERKKYLIIFQNNDEIRPQGGFMGSMGILEIFRGQVKKFNKRDVYDYEFKIKKERFVREIAPEGIKKLTPYLGLRDSNYFINDKDSSEKIKFFINKAGFNIDGIIYINQNTLLKILDLIGEYHSKVLNTDINSKNFSLIMSSLVESKKSKNGTLGTPKKVLFDFIEELKDKILNKNINKLDILKILYEDIKNREIKFYDFNKEERELLEEIGLYNPIKYNKSLDFNYPVFTSISGNKSDRYMKFNFVKSIKKVGNCSYLSNFQINLQNDFNKIEENKILKIFKKFHINTNVQKLLSIEGKGENRQYGRIILPKNSTIKKNDKIIFIKNYKKRGKVVSFYLNTKAGKKSNFNLEYIIPNKNCEIYNYKFYKQPGIKNYNLEINKFGKKNFFSNLKEDLLIN